MRAILTVAVLATIYGSVWADGNRETVRIVPGGRQNGAGIPYDVGYGFGKIPSLETREESAANLHYETQPFGSSYEREKQGAFPFSDFDVKHILKLFPGDGKDEKDGKKFELPDFIKNILNLPKQVLKKICQFSSALDNMDGEPREFEGLSRSGPCEPRYPKRNHRFENEFLERSGRYPSEIPRDYPTSRRRGSDNDNIDDHDDDYPYPPRRYPQDFPYPGRYPSRHHSRYPYEDEKGARPFPDGDDFRYPDEPRWYPDEGRFPSERRESSHPKKEHRPAKPEVEKREDSEEKKDKSDHVKDEKKKKKKEKE